MQPKAETQAMSEYGEPWKCDAIVRDFGEHGVVSFGPRDGSFHGSADVPMAERIVACVNSLAGIPNPEAVRELIEAAKDWGDDELSCVSVYPADLRLMKAIKALSAPSASPQQK